MQTRAQAIRQFILDQVGHHPRDIVARTMDEFNVSRPTVHQHLNRLIRDGKLIKTGRKKGAIYHSPSTRNEKRVFPIARGLEPKAIWRRYFQEALGELPVNVIAICEYAFERILDNTVDHSAGSEVIVKTKWHPEEVSFTVMDDGVGIFHKIAVFHGYPDERESVLDLAGGPCTTDPDHRSGNSLFLAARAVDRFLVLSGRLAYLRDNQVDDWFLEPREPPIKGTAVSFAVAKTSQRTLEEVHQRFTTVEAPERQQVDGTETLLELPGMEGGAYLSRSRAKRLLTGLEKFQHIILDFRNVGSVGQGFVDEVFRVFPARHPGVQLEYTNANPDVEFMIQRGLPGQSG